MNSYYIGVMSGTSMDGADAVLAQFTSDAHLGNQCRIVGTSHLAYPEALKHALLALQSVGTDELNRSATLANTLAHHYADTIAQLLAECEISAVDIKAVGCHGQTIRHCPERGYTLQIGNASLLAELCEMTVIADFRSRDIAAGGQGAPLVPAFHDWAFATPTSHRVIVNIGGIANLTHLPKNGSITGFDSGPGNMLMDAWIHQHLGHAYDAAGAWAKGGQVIPSLLQAMLAEPYFTLAPPKSTGRDLFSLTWLHQHLLPNYAPRDVQSTLLELSACTISDAILATSDTPEEIYLCGGGAYNTALTQRLQQLLYPAKIGLTDDIGISASWVEAVAFAWLAMRTMHQSPSNLPCVTGAKGARILGAIYAN